MKAKTLQSQVAAFPVDRPRVGDGLAVDSPALLLHDCFRSYLELQKTYRWWNRRHHDAAMAAYNQSLARFHTAIERMTTSQWQTPLRRAA